MSEKIDILSQKITKINNDFQKLLGKKESLINSIEKTRVDEEEYLRLQDIVTKAKTLLELFVKGTETSIKEFIEPTITEALQFIFSQPLYFHTHFIKRRNQIEVDFVIFPNSDKEEEYQKSLKEEDDEKVEELVNSYKDIVFNFGGAIAEVLGLILWLLLAEFLKIKGPIGLDEPTSAVHEVYASKVGVFIKSLSERFNRQILYITHSQAMASAANKVYEVKKIGDISVVEEI